MSFWRALIPTLLLSIASCADSPTPADNTPQEFALDQEIGVTPSCPNGDQARVWIEPTGVCGSCVSKSVPGQPGTKYAACPSDPPGTKKLIQNVCDPACDL